MQCGPSDFGSVLNLWTSSQRIWFQSTWVFVHWNFNEQEDIKKSACIRQVVSDKMLCVQVCLLRVKRARCENEGVVEILSKIRIRWLQVLKLESHDYKFLVTWQRWLRTHQQSSSCANEELIREFVSFTCRISLRKLVNPSHMKSAHFEFNSRATTPQLESCSWGRLRCVVILGDVLINVLTLIF